MRRLLGLLPVVFISLAHADWKVWAPNGETQFVGRAIDVETGQPIEGISVIATYILTPGGFHHAPGCAVAEYARSNERGEFTLPFYEGLPPQYLNAFGHRYFSPKYDPPHVTTDGMGGWIVNYRKVGKGRVLEQIRREGPFKTEELAAKASRLLQDVWLEKFEGSDDEWLLKVRHTTTNASYLCPSGTTDGVVGWHEAQMHEAESMPDSPVKREVLKFLHDDLVFARKNASKTTRSHLPKK
jgi:hypothetical protein